MATTLRPLASVVSKTWEGEAAPAPGGGAAALPAGAAAAAARAAAASGSSPSSAKLSRSDTIEGLLFVGLLRLPAGFPAPAFPCRGGSSYPRAMGWLDARGAPRQAPRSRRSRRRSSLPALLALLAATAALAV